MRYVSALAFVLLTALFAAQSASAQTINKLTVDNVGAAINAAGFRYVETRDNRGFPLLQVEIGDSIDANNMNIMFYDCNIAGECEDITMWTFYDTPRPLPAEAYHVWNDVFRQARNWSRAYQDEDGDTILTMNINATGGIGPDAIQILFNTYLFEARDFGVYINSDQ